MYFKQMSQHIGTAPSYLINDLLILLGKVKESFVQSSRPVLCMNNSVLYLRSIIGENQVAAHQLIAQLVSYLYPFGAEFLKEKIPVERAFCANGKASNDMFYGKRYVERVGEKIIVPLVGKAAYTFHPKNSPEQIVEFTPGSIIRVNDRVPTTFKTDGQFAAVVINFLDIDLDRFLTPKDKQATFELATDES